jgi:hypothetical protein
MGGTPAYFVKAGVEIREPVESMYRGDKSDKSDKSLNSTSLPGEGLIKMMETFSIRFP